MNTERIVDRTAGWLGIAFLVVLLTSEAALSLPDEHGSAASVATFYAAHRAVNRLCTKPAHATSSQRFVNTAPTSRLIR